jgi:TolB protein
VCLPDLFTVDADGKKPRKLTKTATGEFEASFSADGKRIAFARGAEEGSSLGETDVWTMRANGSAQTNLTPRSGSVDTEPVFSPDGRSIYFTSDRAGDSDIWRMSASGRNAVNLTAGSDADESSSAISPDAETLAFERRQGGSSEVWLMDASGGGERRLVAGYDPDFAPDGSSVAYAFSGGMGLAGLDGSEPEVLARAAGVSDAWYEPAFSPDGTELAFEFDTHGPQPAVYTSSLGEARKSTLTANSSPYQSYDPDWGVASKGTRRP